MEAFIIVSSVFSFQVDYLVTQGVERELNAVPSTEVKAYSRLIDEDEVAVVHTLKSYRQVIATFVGSL
ncbi:MAG: hypothetical protein GTO12_05730 [Proteobacteria bacterium]|nr:hypothetical protein [Pseudomonadota bacterium]